MKQYVIIGVLALVLILMIAGTTYLVLNTVNFGENVSLLSISDMQKKDFELKLEEANLIMTKAQFDTSKQNLTSAQEQYKASRDRYNAITSEDIEIIKEATKEDHYYVEWLWIVLGKYADNNNLTLKVIDPRSGSEGSAKGTVQINVVGRYQDIANFVFEVENDAELRFKLDNMLMKYSDDNKISATFDVLGMEVLF